MRRYIVECGFERFELCVSYGASPFHQALETLAVNPTGWARLSFSANAPDAKWSVTGQLGIISAVDESDEEG